MRHFIQLEATASKLHGTYISLSSLSMNEANNDFLHKQSRIFPERKHKNIYKIIKYTLYFVNNKTIQKVRVPTSKRQ